MLHIERWEVRRRKDTLVPSMGVSRGGRVCRGGRRTKKYKGTEELGREGEAHVNRDRDNRTKSKRERRKAKRHGSLHGRDVSVEGGKNKAGDEREGSFIFDNDVFFENRRREGEVDGNTVYWELKKG